VILVRNIVHLNTVIQTKPKRAPELRAAAGISDARDASVRLAVCGVHEYAQFRPRERRMVRPAGRCSLSTSTMFIAVPVAPVVDANQTLFRE
jgi:hypothetical protein